MTGRENLDRRTLSDISEESFMATKPSKVIVDRTRLPLPEPPFKGVVGKTYVESK